MQSTPPPSAFGRLAAARPLVDLAAALQKHSVATASGLWGSALAAVTSSLEQQLHRPLLVLCGHIDEADDIADDMELFHARRPQILPTLEVAGNLGRVSEEQVVNRLQLISQLATSNPANLLLVAPIQAMMQQVPSRDQLSELIRTLKPGQTLEPEKLIVWLSEHGFNRLEQVEVPGDFAVRGGIIDVYLPGEHKESLGVIGLPIRIDFFDDQIESIKTFSLDTLGSETILPEVRIVDLRGKIDATRSVSLFSYVPPETIVVFWEPLEIAEQSRTYLDRLPEVSGIYPLSAILKNSERFTRLQLSQFDQGDSAVKNLVGQEVPSFKLPIRSLQRFETEAKKAIHELAELSEKEDIIVFCENTGESDRFRELLEQERPGLPTRVSLQLGYLHRGFVWDEHLTEEKGDTATYSPQSSDAQKGDGSHLSPLALLGHHELFHRYELRRRTQKVTASRPVDSFLDLKVGDYVVHVAHGVAKFTGMQTLTKDGKSDEFLTLRFAENASLHVPAARINLIQKYVGGFHGSPQLSRLGSGAWEKQKEKVAEAVMDMAAELLEVQAARAAEQGTPYPPDTEWQKEFEAEFPYEPTQDQVISAEEIKQDMQKHRPMDRLLCGDVGYGKTEMAMRAAFKAVEFGKQVAVLVPTTVLAEQHFRSFRQRMASYPVTIESISRFRTTTEQKDIIKRTKSGDVDILIGTHRLISKDVNFKDLGLVVIDEEQRFGVTHKERLKQMRKMVDVLTMSATPIPRTLHMSMLGLRDISSLTTAPQDRRSVVTEVMPFDKERVKQAILRELNRQGQIYFVHNRVNDIVSIADMIQSMVPDAKIIVGHGQMEDGEMEDAMLKFIRHDADILVSTTIIESGLDIPNANTIIINNADRFGLSELHQLRGRVGRWKHRAYCYLLLPADRPVTPVAAKRLKAIEEYSHLGAGFKIAMRDLEIRGAGNILGPEQSGHIATVGYEMYCQLLEEATRQLKNEPKPPSPEAHVDIGISAFVPKTYIPADRQRMDLYRRLTRCTSLAMLNQLEQDMKDAFGEPPHPVVLLMALTEMRLLSAHFGIESVIKKDPDVILTVRDAVRAAFALTGAPGTQRVIDERTVYLRMPPVYTQPDTLLVVLRNLFKQAYDREQKGEKVEVSAIQVALTPAPRKQPAPLKSSGVRVNMPIPDKSPKKPTEKPISPQAQQQLQKLESLRSLLTDSEYTAARNRILNQ